MIRRNIEPVLNALLQKFPAVNITGPRQSGKTTLAKNLNGDYNYLSLENPDTRLFAESDPRGFLRSAGEKFILDEVQYVPQLFSYLQEILDNTKENGKVILLGSQSFLMNQHISQSLAGRVASLKLLPLSYSELKSVNQDIVREESQTIDAVLFHGGYPRLFNEKIEPIYFFPNYIETYVQRDVRLLRNIENLNTFVRFIKLCAGRISNILDISSLANDAGVSVNTAKAWLSLLEASYIVYFVQSFSGNVNRRMIKSPKLYFYDTGLACSLLNIEQEKQLETFYLRGALFENFVFSELIKWRFNAGLPANFYFLRDSKGVEIDCVQELPEGMRFVEIKSSETLSKDHIRNIALLKGLFQKTENYVVYSGQNIADFHSVQFVNWHNMEILNGKMM
ncbi:MAG: ATP-binding protein [Bacteroidales bacterium]|jgi:predicted AAA+ superfamily ATPase|nr:ATP-binding protein [Bacteroidales bacterium]